MIVHIVMAADNMYKIPLMVSVLSAVRNRHVSSIYHYHFLIPDLFDETTKSIINTILKESNLPPADFICMGNEYSTEEINIEHISKTTFYRLSLPEKLNEDTCIYLDADTVVLSDLNELYSLLKEDELLAGVKAAGYYWPPESLKEKADILQIPAYDTYINAGVLLMNLKLMREQNLSARFNELLKNNWHSQDQDILNSACYGNIRVIEPKYNSMTKYENDDESKYDSEQLPFLKNCYTKDEWIEACNHPQIIHYADKCKPWDTLSTPHSSLWFSYLKELDYYYTCFDSTLAQTAKKEKKYHHDMENQLKHLIQDNDEIKNSRSYKSGRLITYPLRLIRDLINHKKIKY